MKKSTVTITYNEEKLNAIRLALAEKDLDLDEELNGVLDTFYKKNVHPAVRTYIESKDADSHTVPANRHMKPRKEPTNG
ncbi:MAG: DUF6103 family protein [Candidatus Izemoplasmatales bacterium]